MREGETDTHTERRGRLRDSGEMGNVDRHKASEGHQERKGKQKRKTT